MKTSPTFTVFTIKKPMSKLKKLFILIAVLGVISIPSLYYYLNSSSPATSPQTFIPYSELPESTEPTPEHTSYNPETEGKDITVTLVLTRDFGSELILKETVKVEKGASAMDILEELAEVETKYSGGFVHAINGITNSSTENWFYNINGISANIGAGAYTLYDGDVEHWDFHDWTFYAFTPAIIGHFPEPFLHGFAGESYPTLIVYMSGLEDEAEELRNNLAQQGVVDVYLRNATELSQGEKELNNLILIGTSEQLLISGMNENYKQYGLYAYFEGSKITVLNSKGGASVEYGAGTGLIQATQNPWNPNGMGACENVVWMVSGTDEEGVRKAVDVIINHPSELECAHMAVIGR